MKMEFDFDYLIRDNHIIENTNIAFVNIYDLDIIVCINKGQLKSIF